MKRVLLFTYLPLNETLAKIGTQDIYIINSINIHLEFKEIKNREQIEIESSSQKIVDSKDTGTLMITASDQNPYRLKILCQ